MAVIQLVKHHQIYEYKFIIITYQAYRLLIDGKAHTNNIWTKHTHTDVHDM